MNDNDLMTPELSLHEKALLALRQAVAKVVEEHRRAGLPLAEWRDGKVVLVSADEVVAIRPPPLSQKNINSKG